MYSPCPVYTISMYMCICSHLLLLQVAECEDEHPIPPEEEPPSPPSPPPKQSPEPHEAAPAAVPSSPIMKQRRAKRKKRKKRLHPTGGAEEGEEGRSDGVREDESADELEFHDAHSELPGTTSSTAYPMAVYQCMCIHVHMCGKSWYMYMYTIKDL